MTFDFATTPDRRHTASLKWDKYAGRDIIPLWVADMDFTSPEPVQKALHARVDHGVMGYTLPPDSLVEAVQAYLQRHFAWTIEPDWLVWLPGLVTGLNVACRAVGSPGDDVITATPVYPPFLTAPSHSGRRLVRVPMVADRDRWQWDFDRLEAAAGPRTRLLMLCSPHNPVGRVFSRGELEELVDWSVRHDVIICSDEIHCDLVLDPDRRHIPTATLGPVARDRTITLMAPSKTFNLPGLGCAFAVIAPPELRRRFRHAMAGIVPAVNLLGFAAAEAAYRHGWDWHAALLDVLRGNRDRVQSAVDAMPGLTTWPVEATYLAWIDARAAGIEDPAVVFEEGGVGLSNGTEFGLPGFVRLNFGCAPALLEKALGRMSTALGKRSGAPTA
ncbi:MAG: PatB family C-S lyase [Desulfobacterales bacterium]|nr:PatB family C-S lyase [Desulfobacterales bacterium]